MPWYKDKILGYILGIATLSKLIAFLYLYFVNPLGEQALIFPDSLGYVYPAQTLLEHGALWEAVSATPLLMRTPGYPWLIAFVQFLTANATWAIIFVQNVIALVTLLPIYLTTRQLAGINAARTAAGLYAASTLYFSLAFSILTETWCVFWLAWFIYFLLRWQQQLQWKFIIPAALCLAFSIYIRPAVYYLVPIICIILPGLIWKSKSPQLFCQILCGFILPVIILIGIWQVRNYRQTGYGGFTTVGAYNLYIWNEDYIAWKESISVAQAHQELLARLPSDFYQQPASEQVRLYRQLATPLLEESWMYKISRLPLWAGKTLLGTNYVHINRLVFGKKDSPERTLNQTGALPKSWLRTWPEKIVFLFVFLQVFITVGLGTIGLWLLRKKNLAAAIFLTIYIGYFWAIGSSFFGAYARFRAPFELVFCMTAGLALSMGIGQLHGNKRP